MALAYDSQACEPCEPKQANLVDEITWSLDELEKALSVLAVRLDPVSNNYDQSEKLCDEVSPQASCRLREQLWRLQGFTGRVETLTYRLEI